MTFTRSTTTRGGGALLALAAAGALWGLTVPMSKVGLEWLGGSWLTVARFGLAAPLLAVLARRHLRAALTPGVAAAGAVGSGATVAGDLLVLASVAGAATLIVLQPRLLAGRDPGAVTAVQLGAAALAALPVAAIAEGPPPAPAAAGPIAAVVGLGLAGTLAAFWLFAWAQARVPAELAGAFVNLEPLIGALMGVIAFQDAVGPEQALGGLAILAGIALSALAGRDHRRTDQAEDGSLES